MAQLNDLQQPPVAGASSSGQGMLLSPPVPRLGFGWDPAVGANKRLMQVHWLACKARVEGTHCWRGRPLNG